MNFTINLDDFTLKNASFLEPKKNIIMDGSFTKINYLAEWFTMNSIFLNIPLTIKNIDNNIQFDPYSSKNHFIIQSLSKLETMLLQLYSDTKQKNFKFNTLLSKQLYKGNMKINKDEMHTSHKKIYIIKISGIWQSNNEIGITYKMFLGDSITLL
jgi:hypothetical protein|tara:strand:- start:500 stop:964 length:465 start_codon:yes stop_codon:yes gene_type:complete